MNKKILLAAALAAVAIAVAMQFKFGHPAVVSARSVTSTDLISPESLAAIQRMQMAHGPQRALLATIEIESDPARRTAAVERAAVSVSTDELAVTLSTLAQTTGPAAAELRDELVRRWAETSPAAAAEWAAQLPESAASTAALKQIAAAWADKDLPGATNWLATLPEGEARQSATLDVAYAASVSEPVTALSLAAGLSSSVERDDLLAHAVSQWTTTDSTSAITWAKQIPDTTLREQLLAAAAVSLAGTDAPAAAALVGTAIKPGPVQDRAAVSIVQQWAQTSPQAAANWVNLFPDSPVRTAALQSLKAIQSQQLASASGSM